ncbi:PDDEXK-like family protein [Enterovibrio norvegicus]|uniref:PDDEXK-like family protein n=1 Tax=Enterovibrio norvegicus TaxID=188144 RepID=UPI0010BEFE74|nr:PD-(D/E)XK nuclease family protein [Enterovibrio norvegicus]TKF29319.1 hypothetical protein FCV83_21925 [Enterovibrio norvegicus]
MSLSAIEALLTKMASLQQTEVPEPTLFSIGSRGYYENPTTDVLAFFIDDTAPHGLGSLVLEALVSCLPETHQDIDCSLASPPEREVSTPNGKRIDLLLQNAEWVMVVENKIFHQQNNPFDEYEHHVERYFKDKSPLYLVLSPTGIAPTRFSNWVGVSYPALNDALKTKLAEQFISQPLTKWVILLREFLLHLENTMSKPSLSEENLDFVLNNLTQIKEAQDLKLKVIKGYQQSLHQFLASALDEEINSAVVHWYGFPAIRFAIKDWPTESDVVLFLDGRKDKSFCINYYCGDMVTEARRKVADDHFDESDCIERWNEVRDTYRCYKAKFKDITREAMQEKLLHKMRLMDTFEREIRPTLSK